MKDNIGSIIKEQCTGCGACVNTCHKSAISMKVNFEGFHYPYIDPESCILCGKCKEICPIISESYGNHDQEWYSFVAPDNIRWLTCGGGALITIVKAIIDRGGIVCAPVQSSDGCTVAFEIIEEYHKALMICQKRYTESNAYSIYSKVKKKLEENRTILFVGIPCEVDGLYHYLEKEYINLITIAFACSGISSQITWKSYLTSRNENDTIRFVQLSPKELGCRESIRILFNSNYEKCYEEFEEGEWIKSYRQGLFLRKSCYNCKYSILSHRSDITIGVINDTTINKDRKGASLLGLRSSKAKNLINEIEKSNSVSKSLLSEEYVVKLYKGMIHPDYTKNRKAFFELCEMNGYKKALLYIKNKKDKFINQYRMILDYHDGDPVFWKIQNLSIWRRGYFDGNKILFTNGQMYNRIFMSLNESLLSGIKYGFNIKIKLNTKSNKIRFMFTDRSEQNGRCPTFWEGNITNNTWKIINGTFIPSKSDLNYMMLSSTDFIGEDAYVVFDWIRIWEE